MRKFKGGGGTPAKQEIVQTKLPSYAEPYFTRLLSRAEGESLQGYTPYGGQRIAEFGADEGLAQAMTRGFATQGTPDLYNQAAQNLSTMDPTAFQRGDSMYDRRFSVDPYQRLSFEEGISRFTNPFQQGVTDIAKREARRDSEILANQIESKAAQSGGLGGYREAILQAERERGLGQRLDDIQLKGSNLAFQNAMKQLQAERQTGLAEQQLFEQLGLKQEELAQKAALVDQGAGKLGLQQQQLMTDVGSTIQDDALRRIAALAQIGEQERAMRQAGLDIGYDDFTRQRDYTRDQLNYLSSILQGVPIKPDQSVSTYTQQPGLFQTALSAGLGGLGLYRATQGGGRA